MAMACQGHNGYKDASGGVVAICYALRDHSRKLRKLLWPSQQNLDTRVGLMSNVIQMHKLAHPKVI